MTAPSTGQTFITKLERTRDVLADLKFGSVGQLQPRVLEERNAAVRLIDSFLLPRLRHPSERMIVSFAGPTGSGKSTLVNSIVGREVSDAGYLRPTTRTPLVYTGSMPDQLRGVPGIEIVKGKSPILNDLTLVDTPDIDSTSELNREIALDVLARSDAVVFVASALRYGDMVPWNVFTELHRRGIPIIYVLNRISPDTAGVVSDFRSRIGDSSIKVLRVQEHHLTTGILPPAAIRHLRRDLVGLAGPHRPGADDLISVAIDDLTTRLNLLSDLMREGRAEQARRFSDFDLSVVPTLRADLGPEASRLRELLKASRSLVVGSKTRKRLVDEIGDAVTEALKTVVEQDLRKSGISSDAMTIDLRDEPGDTGILELLDTTIDGWYSGLSPRGIHLSGTSRRRKAAELALDVLAHMPDSRPPVAGSAAAQAMSDLARRLDHLYVEVRERIKASHRCDSPELTETLAGILSEAGTSPALANA